MTLIKLCTVLCFLLINTVVVAHNKVVVVPLGGGNEITVITASINADASVARSNDVGLSVSDLGTGQYVVETSTNVSTCTYAATLGSAVVRSGVDTKGEIAVRPSISSLNSLFVQIHDSAGVNSIQNFHLIIMCQ